ncbi:ABC transporter permease [Kineosporia sp. A_224]|uniref:ABC transporter permease n=1 Tax=Kineosporia sp. A_224 TaxID=1962180 RepID=UPI000B4A667F|nr:ABC transporter permease [Kineosporia sp. A_224]
MTSPTTSTTSGTARPRPQRTPSVVGLGVARTRIELREFFRERDSMVFTFAFPVIMLFIFGAVFSGDIGGGVSFTQYFTAGMIASGIALSSFQSLAIGIAVERDDGALKRLRGTPMPPAAYFLGKIGLVLVTSVVQTAVLLAVGKLFYGLDLPTSGGLWLRFAWIFVLGTAAGTVVGIAYSSVPRSSRSAGAVVSPVVIVLQFISGVFFVYSQLPGWMQNIAAVFPLKWLAQGMRSVFLPADFATQETGGTWALGQTALVLAAWTVVGLLLALRTFRWQRRDAG